MAEQREIVLRIPVAYYRELQHIAEEVHFMRPTEMAEKVIMTFVDNMREKLYPVIEDINKEMPSQPINTGVEGVEPSSTLQEK